VLILNSLGREVCYGTGDETKSKRGSHPPSERIVLKKKGLGKEHFVAVERKVDGRREFRYLGLRGGRNAGRPGRTSSLAANIKNDMFACKYSTCQGKVGVVVLVLSGIKKKSGPETSGRPAGLRRSFLSDVRLTVGEPLDAAGVAVIVNVVLPRT